MTAMVNICKTNNKKTYTLMLASSLGSSWYHKIHVICKIHFQVTIGGLWKNKNISLVSFYLLCKSNTQNVCCSSAFINIIGDTEIWSPSKPMHSENTKLHLWYSQKQKSQKNKTKNKVHEAPVMPLQNNPP